MKTPDYTAYIKNSFSIVIKYKWLWIFGALAGSGSGFSLSRGFDFFNNFYPDQKPLPDPSSSTEKIANVLGSTTSALKDWLQSIPISKWVILSLLLICLIIMGLLIALIIINWSRAGLIKGIDKALSENEVSLETVSPEGFKYLNKMILWSLFLFGIVLCLTTITPLLWLLIYLIIKTITFLNIIWITVGLLAIIPLFFISFLMLTIINAYAERLIILKDYSIKDALKTAVIISRKTLLASALTGLINFGFKIFIGFAGFISLFLLIGLPAYLTYRSIQTYSAFSLFLGILTVFALLIFIFISSVLGASLNVFSYSNWNQLFRDYLKSINGGKND